MQEIRTPRTLETATKFQIRLILEKEMADQLSTIASTKYLSRMSLIRGYLQKAIEEDLNSLSNQLQKKKNLQETCKTIKSIINTKQQKRDYDNW